MKGKNVIAATFIILLLLSGQLNFLSVFVMAVLYFSFFRRWRIRIIIKSGK